MKYLTMLLLSILQSYANQNCVISNNGTKVCFEFIVDKNSMSKHKNLINDISKYCYSSKFDRLVKEDCIDIDNNGLEYNIKVLNDDNNGKFKLKYFNNKYTLEGCQNYTQDSYSASNLKNMCLGESGKHKTFCYNISDSNLKSTCLGFTSNSTQCYNIQDNDLKNLCLAKTKGSNFCYNINNEDLKYSCIGITKNSNSCYNIRDQNLKEMCLGISINSSHCYNIK